MGKPRAGTANEIVGQVKELTEKLSQTCDDYPILVVILAAFKVAAESSYQSRMTKFHLVDLLVGVLKGELNEITHKGR